MSVGLSETTPVPKPSRAYLNIAAFHDFEVTHRILVLKLPSDNVGEYFHLAMRVLSETLCWLDAVLIDNFKGAKAVVQGAIVSV